LGSGPIDAHDEEWTSARKRHTRWGGGCGWECAHGNNVGTFCATCLYDEKATTNLRRPTNKGGYGKCICYAKGVRNCG